QLGGFPFAKNSNDKHRGNDRQRPRYQPAQPRPQPNMEKTFHYDLSGKGAGESRVLTRSEQSDGKKRTGKTDPEQRTEQLVGVLNLRHVFVTGPMESRRGQYQDGGVNEEREHERTGRVDTGIFDCFSFA